jgi:hypothetical protein
VPLDVVKERVRSAANAVLPQSVETQMAVVELRGKQTAGYWFSSTDKAPSGAPTDYKYMSQGIALTGPVTNIFTLLSHDPAPEVREKALRIIASATWSEEPPTAPPDVGSLRIDESREAYRLTVPVSRLVLTIPKGGLKRTENPGNRSPRYFLLQDDQGGTIVSGWFESAEQFRGVEKFWESESSSLKANSLSQPQSVTFSKVSGWDAILYDQTLPGGNNTHLRAEWVAAGTWIDLHLSTTKNRTPAEARAILLHLLQAFRVEQRD